MSLNKFMHPRNRYRKPPDFKALAIKYPDFRKYAKQDISGKVKLNFKDLESVRALTHTLLREDFNLDVEIPLDRLIPTLPLRLNYLLWIEDLLESNKRTSDVKGIDIGCGASCVYPLLAAKQFGWQMLGTEVDIDSAFIASRNIKKNNLEDKIKVRTVKEGQLLDGILDPDTTYDFCMCNPPFFSSTEELEPKNVSRSPNRPAPRNAHSGTTTELVAPGGETAFVTAIIRDSQKLMATIRIYSVMVGHKSSVGKVRQALQHAGVAAASVATSEFCQGHTTRWGVAWTLDPSVLLLRSTDTSQAKKKKNVPFCHTFQSDLTSTVERLKKLLEDLKITYKALKNNQELCAMEITAVENTWANSRKKRRQENLKQKMADSDKNKNGEDVEVKPTEGSGIGKSSSVNESTDSKTKIVGEGSKDDKGSETEKGETSSSEKLIVSGQGNHKGSKRTINDVDESSDTVNKHSTKKPKLENTTPSSSTNSEDMPGSEPILHGSLVVKKTSDSEGCCVEFTWLRGAGGKDSAHQVLQYFKNNFKPH